MRILHVITSLETGGAEKLMVDLLPRLRDRGDDVELLCIDGRRTPFYGLLERQGIKIHSLCTGGRMYDPRHILRLVRFLRRRRYDIVHTHNTAAQLFSAIAGVLCSVVLCTTEHNTSNRRRGWRWYRPVDRWMYRQYKSVVCISDQAEQNLKTYLGKGGFIIRVIYNGIDVERFADAAPCRSLVETKGGRKAVVMVAGFRYQKDQDTLVRAMRLLPETSYELWLVGDGERCGTVEALAKTEGVEGRVRFLGLRDDVPEVLKAADIVVMSSHFEGLSLSNLEGMASGKPFIASDVDGLREIVAGNGLLFPHGDAAALAERIRRLSEDETLRNRVVESCQRKARQYDIRLMADRYDEMYKSLITR